MTLFSARCLFGGEQADKFIKKFTGQLFGRAFYQARSQLGNLASNRCLYLIGQAGCTAPFYFFQRTLADPLAEPATPPLPLPEMT